MLLSGFRREVNENCTLRVITKRVVVIPYQRFGTTSVTSSRVENLTMVPILTLENRTDRLSQNVGEKLQPLAAQ